MLQIDGRFPSTTRTLQDGGNLTIARLTKEDQGLYECIAVNLVASIVTTSLLLIEGLLFGYVYVMFSVER